MSDSIAAEQLRLLIERIERLEEEKRALSEDIKDVYAEAKAVGFDTKTMREIVRLRKMEKHERDEREALLDTYKAALGMDYASTPLGDAAVRRAVADFEKTTEGVAVTLSVDGGDFVPINAKARAEANAPAPLDESALYDQAKALVTAPDGKASTSWLQRQLRLGYNSAAQLIERMEREGIVSAPNHIGARTVNQLAAAAA